MLRTIRRWFSDAETQALARDVELWMDKVLDLAHRGEGFQRRMDRLANRVQMRLARAGVPAEGERDAEILDDIRRRSGNGDEWPFQ